MARRVGLIPAIHIAVGGAVALLSIVLPPRDGDPGSLLAIAEHAAKGLVAYSDYPVEYPPLGLVSIALPRLLGGATLETYQTLFSVVSLVFAIGTGVAVYWLARRRWSVENPTEVALMFGGLALAAAPVVVWRFDILPAFLTAVALVAYAAGRAGWTGMSLGLGFAAKVYPVFLAPVFVLAQIFERRWRDAALLVVATGVTLALIFGELFPVGLSKEFYFLIYQRNRGIEIESISGGIGMLAGALGLSPAKVSVQFGSEQVSSPLLTSIANPVLVFEAIVVLLLVGAALFSFRRDVRGTGRVQPLTIVQYALATVIVAILTNKVFSPQYVVWLLPFVPLMSARKSLLFLVIVVMTTLEYPFNFYDLVHLQLPVVLLVNVRNLLLVALFVWVVWPQREAVQAAADATSRPGSTSRLSAPS